MKNKANFVLTKITGGELNNRTIKSPELSDTHPMGSRERLALMNMIGPDIKGASLIDAFAGTGAVGIEAISRGAAYVVFVEKNHQVAAVLKQNLKELGVSDKATVIEGDVAKLSLKEKFDFVIADPPYKGIKKIKIKDLNGLKSFAKQKFILSHPADFDPHMIDGELSSTRAYAGARLSVFKA